MEDHDFEHLLRSADLRVTRPRLAVLRAVRRHPHADTDSVLAAVRTEEPTVSHQAVYDVLGALTDAGLVRRIQPAGSVARYELARRRQPPPRGLPLVRRRSPTSTAPSAYARACTASDDHGFVIDEAEVIYWGLCPACSTATVHPPTRQHPLEGTP